MDPRIERMAEVLVRYSTAVRPGDWVVMSTSPAGKPLAEACVRAVLRAGGNPSVLLNPESIAETVLREGDADQLDFVPPHMLTVYTHADVHIAIRAPVNTRSLTGVHPIRLAQHRKGQATLGELQMRRAARGEMRWNVTQFPTPAAAQEAGMSLSEYEDFVYSACLVDRDDPAAEWRRLAERQQRLIDWLSDKSEVHVTGRNGTDLSLSIAGRVWRNSDGTRNFPGGEVFTGPVEDSINGVIAFNMPSTLESRQVSGARLEFRDGVVVEATADAGEDFLREMLDMDGGARRLGEFAFGTNEGIQRYTHNTLFDEKIGGTLHMALGRAYPETGSANNSALHWDMVFDLRPGGEVTVDGIPFSRDGRFLVPS